MNKILFLLPFEEYITKLDKVCAKSSVWMYILMYQKMACPFWGIHNRYQLLAHAEWAFYERDLCNKASLSLMAKLSLYRRGGRGEGGGVRGRSGVGVGQG